MLAPAVVFGPNDEAIHYRKLSFYLSCLQSGSRKRGVQYDDDSQLRSNRTHEHRCRLKDRNTDSEFSNLPNDTVF